MESTVQNVPSISCQQEMGHLSSPVMKLLVEKCNKAQGRRITVSSHSVLVPSCTSVLQLDLILPCFSWAHFSAAFPDKLRIFLQYTNPSNLTVAKGKSISVQLQLECHHLNSRLFDRPYRRWVGIMQKSHLVVLRLISHSLVKFLNITATNSSK